MEQTKVVQPEAGERAGLSVATALRAELARQNISATELAARLLDKTKTDVDPRYVRRRINGQTPLTLDDVQWFAAALNIPMGDLLAGLPS